MANSDFTNLALLRNQQQLMLLCGVRRVLVLSGTTNWGYKNVHALTKILPGDWLWIGESESLSGEVMAAAQAMVVPDEEEKQPIIAKNTLLAAKKTERCVTPYKRRLSKPTNFFLSSKARKKVISVKKIKTLLGQEKLHAFFDASAGLNIEALAVLIGTLQAGSWLLLLVPEWQKWLQQIDNDSLRWHGAPMSTPHFVRHLQHQLLLDKEVAFWHQGTALMMPPLLPRPAWQAPKKGATRQQQAILQELLAVKTGIWVLTAARGRGKSTLAGMLAEKWQGICWVIGPSKATIKRLSDQAGGRVQFWAPDRLLQYCRKNNDVSQVDWLLIDEAAALPSALLSRLLPYFSRILLTTTVEGYEGTGQRFLLKFCANLPHCQHRMLSEPLRWAAADPLDNLLAQILLVTPLPEVKKNATAAQIISCTQELWSSKPQYLQQFYSLLSSAHYRTSPQDLRRLLDAPGMHFTAATVGESMVAALWMVDEGGLTRQLAREIWAGRRRPRGNLVAQSLAAHGSYWLAPTLRSRRISRIVVAPAWRQQNIARDMIAIELKRARQQQIDFLSVSFSYSEMLSYFWQACGFKLLWFYQQKREKNNDDDLPLTAIAIIPLTAVATALQQAITQQYQRDSDSNELSQPPDVLSKLSLNRSPYCNAGLNDDDWRELAGFAFAHRSIASSAAALKRLLLNSPLPLNTLRLYLQQKKPLQEIIKSFSLLGRKNLLMTWRKETEQAMWNMDENRTIFWQSFAMNTD